MSTETDNRKHIIDVAKSYIGAVGGSSAHSDILHFFNTVKPLGYSARKNDPWCAEFVSSCAIQAFGKKDAISFFPLTASCPRMIVEAKSKSIWYERDSYKPKVGDWILYDWDDDGKGDNRNTPDHVGIVEKIKDNIITVIEGNYNNKVKRRQIEIDGRYIRGYVVPHYERINAKVYKKTDSEIIKEVLSGDWGRGVIRKKALMASGYDSANIQKEVNRINKLTEETIKGKYGNGEDRKHSLGKDYSLVQWNVNRILNERN